MTDSAASHSVIALNAISRAPENPPISLRLANNARDAEHRGTGKVAANSFFKSPRLRLKSPNFRAGVGGRQSPPFGRGQRPFFGGPGGAKNELKPHPNLS
jgi:hypothetical protein